MANKKNKNKTAAFGAIRKLLDDLDAMGAKPNAIAARYCTAISATHNSLRQAFEMDYKLFWKRGSIAPHWAKEKTEEDTVYYGCYADFLEHAGIDLKEFLEMSENEEKLYRLPLEYPF